MSPTGQADAVADLTSGWRTIRSGRRRALRMLLWLAVVVAVAVGFVLVLARQPAGLAVHGSSIASSDHLITPLSCAFVLL